MSLPGPLVAPPVETPSVHGLLSAARVLPMGEHEEAGIRYEAICDDAENLWPGACQPIPPGPPIPRTLTLTLAGQRAAGPPVSYTIIASATVDSGAPRRLAVVVGAAPAVTVTTGQAPTVVSTSPNAGAITITVTDESTQSAHPVTVTQSASDGVITPASAQWEVTDSADYLKIPGDPYMETISVPMGVYGVEQCQVGYTAAEHEVRARARLQFIEESLIERAFWTGWNGVTPALVSSAPKILSVDGAGAPVAVDLSTGIGLLEQDVGISTPYIGFLHAPRHLAALLNRYRLAVPNGPRMMTALGNVWVFGAGYTGSKPNTVPPAAPLPDPGPTQSWLYLTRQVTVRRSEVFVPATDTTGAFGFATNKLFVVAERVYVVDFPCKTAAVLVDTSLSLGSGAKPAPFQPSGGM